MLNTNWRDLYDRKTDTRVRVSPEVLTALGHGGVVQVALHVKARNPKSAAKNDATAEGYAYTANGMELVAGAFVVTENAAPVSVILISTREQWAEYHPGQGP